MKRKADGGKVKGSEYGKPTYARAVMARVGVGDGYGNPKTQPKAESKRMSVSNSTAAMSDVVSKRKKMLDEYADGGKVKKRKGC